jgi:L-threonylcarbamoyladenylate synthase
VEQQAYSGHASQIRHSATITEDMSDLLQTLHLSADSPNDIAEAAQLLREGRLVAFATETVYGLGANALSADAVAGIFRAKQRPSWDPLIVHIASTDQLARITKIPPELASRISTLASIFWPGPLTLLLPRSDVIPDAVTAGRDLVGVRIPSHPAALALLTAADLPIAAPSANRFGHTSPTTAAHVHADLDGRIDAVLDAGPTTVGLESTVIDPTQTPMVLYRPGAVTAAQLTAATGIPVTTYEPPQARATPESLPSPGVGIRHYAPRAQLILIHPSPVDLEHSLLAESTRQQGTIGLMLPDNWAALPQAHIYPWGGWNDPETLAVRLFAGLRFLDDAGVHTIFCPLPLPGGLRDALRDRLKKAAIPS